MTDPIRQLKDRQELKEAFQELSESKGEGWVYASAALTLNGRLGAQLRPFGGEADREFYAQMTEVAGSIIIGAETVRRTGQWYKPGKRNTAIISASGRLPEDAPLLSETGRVTVYTSSDRQMKCSNPELQVKRGHWTAERILADLEGAPIMIDGGGQIYSMFSDYIDDWFTTSVPVMAGQEQPEIWRSGRELNLNYRWILAEENRLLSRLSRSPEPR